MTSLVLSLFPGIGLLDRAFEETGFCVVRGPDVLWGGDIRTFHPPAGVFDGVIGGPPCQTFSALAHLVRANGGQPRFGNLIPEFERCIVEAQPEWFVMENVPGAPEPVIDGYAVHAQLLNNRWLPDQGGVGAEQNRVRRICFGTHDGRPLRVEIAALESPISVVAVKSDPRPTRRGSRAVLSGPGFPTRTRTVIPGAVHAGHDGTPSERTFARRAVAASDTGSHGGESRGFTRYTVERACELQGLPADYLADAPFTREGKLKAVANGVPLPMGRAIAAAVRRAMEGAG